MHFNAGDQVYFFDPALSILISYDKPPFPGWVAIGRVGESGLMIEESEWEAFAQLVANANQYIAEHRKPAEHVDPR